MAKHTGKRPHFPWYPDFDNGVLPRFDLSDRFCYFLDLYESSTPNISLNNHKKELYRAAVAGIARPLANELKVGVSPGEESETIRTAIDFLNTVAQNERNKEISAIRQYAEYLQSIPLFKNFLNNNKIPNINKLIQSLENFSKDPSSGSVDTFYQDLTICINLIRKQADSFQVRLQQLLTQTKETQVRDLMDKNASFLAGSTAESVVRSMIGLKTHEYETSFNAKFGKILIDFVNDYINKDPASILNINFLAFATALTYAFLNYLQTNADKLGIGLHDIGEELLNDLWEKFLISDEAFARNMREKNSFFYETLASIEQNMGFTTLSKEEQQKTRQNQINARGRRNYGKNLLTSSSAGKNLHNVIKFQDFLRFDIKSKKGAHTIGHGTIFELIEQTINDAIKVQGNAATDVISTNIGTIEGSIDPKFNNIVFNQLKDMVSQIENFEKVVRADRKASLTAEFQLMNEKIVEILKILDKQLEELQVKEKLFIYHESLKLYVQIEQHKTSEFEGRELTILNALDNLVALNDINGLMMPDLNVLYPLVLNIPSKAVAHDMKPSVENYLSIFAGLLMFDEIQNMALEAAKDATQKIEYSNLTNIHLYLLNNIYIPGSLLLTSIASALEKGYQQIRASNSYAHVVVETKEADNTITEYIKEHPYGSKEYKYIKDWEEIGEKIKSQVKVQIIFMNSFITFIKDLQERFGK